MSLGDDINTTFQNVHHTGLFGEIFLFTFLFLFFMVIQNIFITITIEGYERSKSMLKKEKLLKRKYSDNFDEDHQMSPETGYKRTHSIELVYTNESYLYFNF